jgi:hypothetical protein
LPPSRCWPTAYGQCNTKSTLLMALLRAVGIPCRFHGFTIDKPLQKGAITGLAYWLAPQRIIHSWVEVNLESRWIALEGFILDASPTWPACSAASRRRRRFCGYGAATPDLSMPGVDWRGTGHLHPEGRHRRRLRRVRQPRRLLRAPRLQPLGPQTLAVPASSAMR